MRAKALPAGACSDLEGIACDSSSEQRAGAAPVALAVPTNHNRTSPKALVRDLRMSSGHSMWEGSAVSPPNVPSGKRRRKKRDQMPLAMPLPEHLKQLLTPAAYPHPVTAVELIETHISWVLLTGQFAYKIKRPVAHGFIDLRSREYREHLCHEEVRLNRRFAPDLYQGVCRVTMEAAGARIDGSGPVVEHAVKIVQFDRTEQLDCLLASKRIAAVELRAFACDLARIQATLPTEAPDPRWGGADSVREVMLRNADELLNVVNDADDTSRLRFLREQLEVRLRAAHSWLTDRHARGRVRECHGDLHCSNLVRRHQRLVAFDCLEFDPVLRWIDVVDEVAFLLADIDARDRPADSQAVLDAYLQESGDYQACEHIDLYKAHRSLVRAKVALLSTAVAGATAAGGHPARAGGSRYDVHVRCASASLQTRRPMLVLMSGLSGSGKSWLASRLAPLLGAMHIRSDLERKRLAGLHALAGSGSSVGQGLYSPANTERLHQHLQACVQSSLNGGYTAILDATLGGRAERGLFAALGRKLGVPTCLLQCEAPEEVLKSRIVERGRLGSDPSEADLAVLQWQLQHREPIHADEELDVLRVDTAQRGVLETIRQHIVGTLSA
jgi:aminoglycoside phosphotransferase family enzyme/predicted kinase